MYLDQIKHDITNQSKMVAIFQCVQHQFLRTFRPSLFIQIVISIYITFMYCFELELYLILKSFMHKFSKWQSEKNGVSILFSELVKVRHYGHNKQPIHTHA